MNKKTRSGFTLPEVLLASAISVMVFFALGTLLTRSFSIWYSGMAQWKLAQHARVTRIRIMDGGFGTGTGMLSATNHTVTAESDSTQINYYPVFSGKEYRCNGGTSSTNDILLYNNDPAVPITWAYGQSVKNVGDEVPDVKVGNFTAEFVGPDTLQMTYVLRFSAAGKEFEHPQTIRMRLLNSN